MNDRRRTLIAWLAALALACGGDDGGTEASTVDASTATDTESSSDGSESESETDTDTGATTEPGKTDSVDILFVVDNSETMGPAQGRLGFSAGVFIEALLAAGLDLRVGVTTTDMGNPRCMGVNPPPQLGRLEPSSCVQRIDEFTLDDIADSNVGCLDICQHNSYSLLPTAIDDAPGLTQRSWLESIDGVSNVDVPLSEAVACMLPQGITGCGFESPLEAMHAALTRGDTPGDPNEGFVRDDADLLVIFFSDELDCSFDQSAAEVFIANQTFWAPGSTQATSAVCWNAGVTCDGAAPGPYSSCHAENKDVSGASGVPDPAAVLRPMSRYRACSVVMAPPLGGCSTRSPTRRPRSATRCGSPGSSASRPGTQGPRSAIRTLPCQKTRLATGSAGAASTPASPGSRPCASASSRRTSAAPACTRSARSTTSTPWIRSRRRSSSDAAAGPISSVDGARLG